MYEQLPIINTYVYINLYSYKRTAKALCRPYAIRVLQIGRMQYLEEYVTSVLVLFDVGDAGVAVDDCKRKNVARDINNGCARPHDGGGEHTHGKRWWRPTCTTRRRWPSARPCGTTSFCAHSGPAKPPNALPLRITRGGGSATRHPRTTAFAETIIVSERQVRRTREADVRGCAGRETNGRRPRHVCYHASRQRRGRGNW